jgi:hypothetical protein
MEGKDSYKKNLKIKKHKLWLSVLKEAEKELTGKVIHFSPRLLGDSVLGEVNCEGTRRSQ